MIKGDGADEYDDLSIGLSAWQWAGDAVGGVGAVSFIKYSVGSWTYILSLACSNLCADAVVRNVSRVMPVG